MADIEKATQDLVTAISDRYKDIQANNKPPSMVELVGIAVQLAEKQPLSGAQKMVVVKAAVEAVIDHLPVTDDEKVRLRNASHVAEDVAETALSLLKANSQLSGCLNSCFSKASSDLHVPFPLIN